LEEEVTVGGTRVIIDHHHHSCLVFIRCLFAWAKKSRDPPKDADKRITYSEYMDIMKEAFPNMGKVSEECMKLYGKSRVADFENSGENRSTFRTGIIYYILLAITDMYVSNV